MGSSVMDYGSGVVEKSLEEREVKSYGALPLLNVTLSLIILQNIEQGPFF